MEKEKEKEGKWKKEKEEKEREKEGLKREKKKRKNKYCVSKLNLLLSTTIIDKFGCSGRSNRSNRSTPPPQFINTKLRNFKKKV